MKVDPAAKEPVSSSRCRRVVRNDRRSDEVWAAVRVSPVRSRPEGSRASVGRRGGPQDRHPRESPGFALEPSRTITRSRPVNSRNLRSRTWSIWADSSCWPGSQDRRCTQSSASEVRTPSVRAHVEGRQPGRWPLAHANGSVFLITLNPYTRRLRRPFPVSETCSIARSWTHEACPRRIAVIGQGAEHRIHRGSGRTDREAAARFAAQSVPRLSPGRQESDVHTRCGADLERGDANRCAIQEHAVEHGIGPSRVG